VFVIGNLLNAVAWLLDVTLQMLLIIIFINALLSWFNPDRNNPLVQFLDRVSDMVCDPLRRLFPLRFSGIDFAPFIAMLALVFIRMFAVETLRDIAVRMG
jgi:YggT family protein